jgi:preprotein translocase subunit SecG
MYIFLLLVHLLVCVILIMVVLLQSGKAADLAGAFGGGGSQTALGSRGAATFLTKATSTSAILFMLTSLGLALLGSRQGGSVLETTPVNAPAVPSPASKGPAGNEAGGTSGAAPAAAAPAAQDTGGKGAAPANTPAPSKPAAPTEKPK